MILMRILIYGAGVIRSLYAALFAEIRILGELPNDDIYECLRPNGRLILRDVTSPMGKAIGNER